MANNVAKSSKPGKEGAAEKTARFFRNINALGAIALGGAALILPAAAAAPAMGLAAIDVAQAAGFEGARRIAKKRRAKKADK